VTFSANGQYFASGGADQQVRAKFLEEARIVIYIVIINVLSFIV
jgi:hypothetical protein